MFFIQRAAFYSLHASVEVNSIVSANQMKDLIPQSSIKVLNQVLNNQSSFPLITITIIGLLDKNLKSQKKLQDFKANKSSLILIG